MKEIRTAGTPVLAFTFLVAGTITLAAAGPVPAGQEKPKENAPVASSQAISARPLSGSGPSSGPIIEPGSLATAQPASAATRKTKSLSEALASHFPNVVLHSQDDKALRFYDDLVKGKVVIIHLMFTSCNSLCPISTSNLAKVQDLLGEYLGRDVFFLSLSLDPATDTPEVLRKFAGHFKAKPGWYFLTGAKQDIDLIRRKLGVYDKDITQHTGILTMGNEATGTWFVINSTAKPNDIASTVQRLLPVKTK